MYVEQITHGNSSIADSAGLVVEEKDDLYFVKQTYTNLSMLKNVAVECVPIYKALVVERSPGYESRLTEGKEYEIYGVGKLDGITLFYVFDNCDKYFGFYGSRFNITHTYPGKERIDMGEHDVMPIYNLRYVTVGKVYKLIQNNGKYIKIVCDDGIERPFLTRGFLPVSEIVGGKSCM